MWNDTVKTIKAQLYERASSPLLSTFLISWIIWNHRFLAVLFSRMNVTDKFSYIDSHFFITLAGKVIWGFAGPLLTGLAAIYLYPIPAKKVYEHWRIKQKEQKEIQQKIEDEMPLTKEEARQIRREVLENEIKHEQELEQRSKEIARLRELVDGLQNRQSDTLAGAVLSTGQANLFQAKRNKQDETIELTKDQKLLLYRTAERGPVSNAEHVAREKDKVLAEYNLDQLHEKGLIESNGDGKYKASRKGRQYLIENNIGKQLFDKNQ